jgi:iron complex outermembrane receptor protein
MEFSDVDFCSERCDSTPTVRVCVPTRTGLVLLINLALIGDDSAQERETAATERVVVSGSEVSAEEYAVAPTVVESDNALVDSLSIRAPNFIVNEAGASSFNDVYSVRGLANTPNFSKQAVVLYVDDVPSSSTFTNFTDLLSPSSIELFRGPQGDFFGKNAEAGVINVRTPQSESTGRFFSALTIGDYNLQRFNVTAAEPVIGDALFLKLDLLADHRDGYLHNTFLDTHPDYQNHVAGRLLARLVFSRDWEVTASVEVHNNRDGVQRFVALAGDPFDVRFDFDGRTRIQGDIEALRVTRVFGNVRVIMISSRRDWRLNPYEADFDYSSEPIVRGRFQLRQTQLAQEIRTEPTTEGAEWDWRAGIFADRVTTSGDELYALPGFAKRITFDDREYDLAAFGQLTRRFGRTELLGGMRLDYTSDGIGRQRHESFSSPSAFTTNLDEWNVQPKLGVRYRCSDDADLYARMSYGYKNGGFSFLETDPSVARYDAEHVWSNEIGFHTSLANERVTVQGAAFYNSVQDYQVERLSIPPNITVVNAPHVIIWGGEASLTATPIDVLELRVAMGYLHSEFTRFRDPLANVEYAGNSVPFAPEFTVAINMRYHDPHGPFAELELLATGETFYDEANTAFLSQAPHAELNIKLGYERKGIRFYGYCENANDAQYFTQKIGYAGIGTPAPPRTFGAVLAIDF